MSRDDAVLLDMLRAARLVVEFRAGLDKITFLDDLKTQSSMYPLNKLGQITL